MEEIKFEDAMKKLEDIAKELEKDSLTLEDSITKFEEGIKLSKECKNILDNAEKRITVLLNDKEENFEIKE